MNTERMPVIFSGHGSPMLALAHDDITKGLAQVGCDIINRYGKPKAILAVSSHWFSYGTRTQSAAKPKQVYDMYGFPEELYQVQYPVFGCEPLTQRVQELLGDAVEIDDSWGIDHGVWTVLVHMFPDADIPVVELSVSRKLDAAASYEVGKKLNALRDEGYLIFGSGNVVHNLSMVQWGNPGGTPMAERFNDTITAAVVAGDAQTVIDYQKIPEASYAVPTPDHFLPLLYCMGAAEGDAVTVFNNTCNLGSMAMTGYIFG